MPDESLTERVARLEANYDNLTKDVAEIKVDVKSLVAAANMGKGAWLTALKIGGLMVTIAAALAWVIDRFIK